MIDGEWIVVVAVVAVVVVVVFACVCIGVFHVCWSVCPLEGCNRPSLLVDDRGLVING